MADWFNPVQYMKARETTWKKLEKTNKELINIPEEYRIYYYGKKNQSKYRFEYDCFFNKNNLYNPKLKKDSERSTEKILDNIYQEEMSRRVPLITSHLYGHWLNNIEGCPIANHKKIINKSNYRLTGIPINTTIVLPKIEN
ncbi:uncharacterized protein LOC126902067, partial [Daktulosphaira vitifoliae]|uniref:uncharacterized protein LOC126902067 n=1 Tax=Daktulosphaira vitifoliae TaxID=58002 RepID=UPI0021A9E41D